VRARERLAAPISEHVPDLVLHGHGHAGTFEASIGKVPVYNVSIPVIQRDWVFELENREGKLHEHPLDHPHRDLGPRAARVLLARLLVGPSSR
jgi:hypothetical protein